MEKKLTKFGNSYGIILDKAILDLLGITQDTKLNISTPDGKCLVISPSNMVSHNENLQSSMDKINKKYSKALQNLAK